MHQNLEGSILGQCNPLLDISANVDQTFLDKYDVKLNNAVLAEQKHLPLFKELEQNYQVEYIAGGSGLNTIRVAQWMLNNVCNKATGYMGCIGNDEHGRILTERTQADNVTTYFQIDATNETGMCGVLVKDKERSLVANLSAANNFKAEFIQTIQEACNKAQIIYSTGFVLTACPDGQFELAQLCLRENKIFATNLSAPFISQFFSEPQMKLMPYVDLIFGNETEAIAFADKQKCKETDIPSIAKFIANLPKENSQRPRVVIITQGCDPTIAYVSGTDAHLEIPVVPIAKELIVDTNGAGDAFAGGYLSQLAQKKSVEECVKAGQYASSVIIQVSGTKLPDHPSKY